MRRVAAVEPAEAVPDLMHQLRNQLTALKSGVSLLRHTARPAGEARELLDQVEREIDRLDVTTRSTQRYFRLTAGRPRAVRIAEVVRDALSAAAAGAASRGVEIVVEGDEGKDVTVDREQLLFSLAELIANACRQSPPGSCVRISWRRARTGLAAVDVSGGGPGIPEAHARQVGRPFFTTSGERAGLGLATVARVCRLAGGSLGWSNLAGGGCRFTMELPVG